MPDPTDVFTPPPIAELPITVTPEGVVVPTPPAPPAVPPPAPEPKPPEVEPPTVEGFKPEEYGPVLGEDRPPEVWEIRGYQPWYYRTREGRETILQDIARAREGAVEVTPAMLARAKVHVPSVEPSVIQMAPRDLEFPDRRGFVPPPFLTQGQKAQYKRTREERKKHLEEAKEARKKEREEGKAVHTIAYHIKQKQIGIGQRAFGGKAYVDMTEEQKALYKQIIKRPATTPAIASALAGMTDTQRVWYRELTVDKKYSPQKAIKSIQKAPIDVVALRNLTKDYLALSGEAQFKFAKMKGMFGIPKDAKYVDMGDGTWGYLIPEVTQVMSQEEVEKVEAWGEEFVTFAKEKRELQKTHIELPGDEWMLAEDVERIKEQSPELHSVLISDGYDAYKKTLGKAEESLAPFAHIITVYVDGKPRLKKTESIDYIKAVKAGKVDEVRMVFGVDALREAEEYISTEIEFNDKYKGDLHLAVLGDMPYKKLNLLFDNKTLNKAYRDTREFRSVLEDIKELKDKSDKGKLSIIDSFKLQMAEEKLAIYGLPYAMAEGERRYFAPARKKMAETFKNLPAAIKMPTEFVARTAMGALILAPLYTGAFVISVAGIPLARNKVFYSKQVGKGIVNYFGSIPAQVKADPMVWGELIGIFILGPTGALKLARGVAARGSPWYIPNTGMRYSFTTGKIATRVGEIAQAIKQGKITDVAVARAIARAENRALKNPAAMAKARIGKSNIYITIDPTPVSKRLGGILWHASPSKEAYRGLEFLVEGKPPEPALFTSLHAAPRFALQSAYGPVATKPCLVMIYTKKGGLQWYPSSIAYAKNLASLEQKGFEFLGSGRAKPGAYGPIKTFLNRFENEVMLPNGMRIYRARNLKSRILGAGAGEFVTTVDGWVMPIFRFAEKGANIPHATLSRLAAIRVQTIWHGMNTLLGKKGFKAKRIDVEALSRELDAVGVKAGVGKRGKAYAVAYEKAVDEAMARRIREMYVPHRAILERAWRANPEAFEVAYRNRLTRNIARHYRVATPRLPRTIPRYIIVPRDIREEQRIAEARAERVSRQVDRPRRVYETIREEYIPREPPRVRGPVPRGARARIPTPPRITTARMPTRREPPVRRPPRDRVPPPPPPPPRVPRKRKKKEERKVFEFQAPIAWRQGFGWWVIFPPYKTKADVKFMMEPPKGATEVTGPGSAYKTIQALGGEANIALTIDMGIMDVTITRPSRASGKKGSIKYKRDPKQRTKRELSITGVRR